MKSIFSIFQKGLQKTATSISRSFESIFKGQTVWNAETYEKMERTLIEADFGRAASSALLADIRDRYERGLIHTSSDIFDIAKKDLREFLAGNMREIRRPQSGPAVILIVGVNGSGKTTTAGKMAWLWKNDGKKVMLAACDTYRAAAVEQLKLWGGRTDCPVISSNSGSDPAAVAYDAVSSALSKNCDYLIIDTAGRQHTKKGLMDELSKMCRVIKKVLPDAPHETFLTIDSSTGTNALSQARNFLDSAAVSGLILTKLDGTGKAGTLTAIQKELALPVFFIGLGEQAEDLQPFDPEMYANAIFSDLGIQS